MNITELNLVFGEPVYSVTWPIPEGESGLLLHNMAERGLLLTGFGRTGKCSFLLTDQEAFRLASSIYDHLDRKLLGEGTSKP